MEKKIIAFYISEKEKKKCKQEIKEHTEFKDESKKNKNTLKIINK